MVSVLVASAYLSVEREELGFHTRVWLIHSFNMKSAHTHIHISRVRVPLSWRTSTTPYIYLSRCSDPAWTTSSALLCEILEQLRQGKAVLASGSGGGEGHHDCIRRFLSAWFWVVALYFPSYHYLTFMVSHNTPFLGFYLCTTLQTLTSLCLFTSSLQSSKKIPLPHLLTPSILPLHP